MSDKRFNDSGNLLLLGALVNHYGTQWVHGGSGPDNNGNVLMSQTIINSYFMEDRYSYDALNRLTSVAEWQNGATNTGVQTYAYDRYGNRTIDAGLTWGQGINNKQFTVNTANNRLGVPGGQGGAMSYDTAGNLTTDTYSGAGDRVYDAENRMTKAWGGNNQWQEYTYNADGQRVRRKVDCTETWQVAGMDGELLAEYAVNGATSSPQKEYGYRNGELLITATTASSGWGSPPIFANNPLIAGETSVQALHITQLRDAINAVRGHMSLSAYSWQYSATTNDWISANPILEMRTALDQALGAPTGGYSPGLAQYRPILAIHIQELRNRVVAAWTASSEIPADGHANLSYDSATNRITTAGFAYDAAGNQVRALIPGSSNSQRFQYDAANRLVKVKADDNVTVKAGYTYGDSNERLILEEAGVRTYYACDGSAEYTESGSSTTPQWSKTYIYLGARLLSTLTPNGSGGHAVQYHHPDRLSTRLVTNAQDTGSFEQVTLPFGTALNAESSGATNRRFTTYDRSVNTGLDYAVNRHYDAQQGRFTQVDPIGISASSLVSPQTLNMYSYVGNDPVNRIDPSGLF
jgi:RHS repeat-associated protein